MSTGVSWSKHKYECVSPCVCDCVCVCMLARLLGRVQGFCVQLYRPYTAKFQGALFRKQEV